MTSPVHEPSAVGERDNGAADVTGVLVLGACAAWALITAAGRDARPEGLLLAVLAVGAGYVTGRIAGSLAPAGAAVGAGAVGVFLALFGPSTSRMISGGIEFAGPEGRSGVTAALLTLSVGAFCCAAWAAPARPVRVVLRVTAAGTVVGALLVGTPVGSAAALAVLLCSLAVGRVRRRRRCLAAMALAVVAVTGVTFAVAQGGLPRGATVALHEQLTGHRVELWQDALAITRDHPVLGAGPDTFRDLSVTAGGEGAPGAVGVRETAPAQQAPYSDGKPHSAPLQVAAEQGLPGLVLLAAAFGWLLLALRISPRATPLVLTAAAALSALGALSAIGNALSFTQVTAGAGLLAGIACARGLAEPAARPEDG
ncbi:O-antigen ligase family protein [Streptomyces sp. HNM0575]|uniref:O-antigen ligase family protein n=1 Tax=Streptomyces sp. HNM0575 TaxID=2716338 RepID=UPI00145D2053|nr:O-antigen ligase family protein [Streptomyces sp. HNM0575]NLU73566.1 O-antigen ligase family protein [Streptomyces sp. HNM0575]